MRKKYPLRPLPGTLGQRFGVTLQLRPHGLALKADDSDAIVIAPAGWITYDRPGRDHFSAVWTPDPWRNLWIGVGQFIRLVNPDIMIRMTAVPDPDNINGGGEFAQLYDMRDDSTSYKLKPFFASVQDNQGYFYESPVFNYSSAEGRYALGMWYGDSAPTYSEPGAHPLTDPTPIDDYYFGLGLEGKITGWMIQNYPDSGDIFRRDAYWYSGGALTFLFKADFVSPGSSGMIGTARRRDAVILGRSFDKAIGATSGASKLVYTRDAGANWTIKTFPYNYNDINYTMYSDAHSHVVIGNGFLALAPYLFDENISDPRLYISPDDGDTWTFVRPFTDLPKQFETYWNGLYLHVSPNGRFLAAITHDGFCMGYIHCAIWDLQTPAAPQLIHRETVVGYDAGFVLQAINWPYPDFDRNWQWWAMARDDGSMQIMCDTETELRVLDFLRA